MKAIQWLEAYDLLGERIPRWVFRAMFARGRPLTGQPDRELADDFGVSHPTIARWVSGDTAPGPVARKHYLDKLARVIRESLCSACEAQGAG